MLRRIATVAIAVLSGLVPAPAHADPALDVLVAAYPDHLSGHEGNDLTWKDGTRMPISDGRPAKSFEQLLDEPDIKDQFAFPYPLGGTIKTPGVNEDPGRIRNEKFYLKMYGDCRKGEVTKRMKPVAWMPGRRGGRYGDKTVAQAWSAPNPIFASEGCV